MTQVPNIPLVPEDSARRVKKAPQSNFLGRLSVGQKLGLLSLSLGLPLIITSFVLGKRYLDEVNTSRLQSQVVSNYKYAVSLQQSTRFINGYDSKTILSKYPNWLESIDKGTQDLDNNLATLNIPEVTKLSQSLRKKAENYISLVKAGKTSSTDLSHLNVDMQTNEIAQLFTILNKTGNLGAVQDQKLQDLTYFVTKDLPTSLPNFGRIYTPAFFIAYDAAGSLKGKLSDAQVANLKNNMAESRTILNNIQTDYRNLLQSDPALENSLSAPFNTAYSGTTKALDLTDGTLKGNSLTPNLSELNPSVDKFLVTQYDFFQSATKALEQGFIEKQNLANKALQTLLLILGLLALLVILALRAIAQSISRPLQQLTLASQQLSTGQYIQVPISSQDELGALSRSFNTASEQLRANELRVQQEREEAARLQGNIGEFLDVTMDIAEGDLTKRGKVTEDVLGNVVDSVNLMAEELATVLKDVQNASNSVAGGSRAMLSTTEQINQGTQLTATEAERVTAQVQELTAAIRNMALSAQTSAETARQALLASQQGQEAVSGTLEGMQNVRREVQDIAKRVKGLGDRSLEIQEIVDTISQIARQTNLLALNAAIEAAGAGEAGGRFTIVADEVRKLADTSGQATARIAALIKNVQSEIQDVVVRVEEGTREVEQGYRVAGTAGERLREIGTLSERSAQLAEQISDATQQQVRGIEQMGQAVAQINNIAQESTQSVEEGRAAAEQLQQLAGRLNSSLSRFRLPE